jgi:hypothetical protein
VVVWKLMVAVDHPVHEREGEERKREDREEKERVVLFNLPTSRANRFSVTKPHHLLWREEQVTRPRHARAASATGTYMVPHQRSGTCESASRRLLDFSVLNDNLIKGLILCVKYLSRL